MTKLLTRQGKHACPLVSSMVRMLRSDSRWVVVLEHVCSGERNPLNTNPRKNNQAMLHVCRGYFFMLYLRLASSPAVFIP